AREQQPRVFRKRDGYRLSPSENSNGSESLAEWVCVPIIGADGRLAGQIIADNGPTGPGILEDELSPLALFAEQIVAVVASPPLALIETKAKNLQAVLDLAGTTNSSLRLEQILGEACRMVVELTHVDHSGLVLFDPSLKKGTVVAEYPSQVGAIGTIIPL